MYIPLHILLTFTLPHVSLLLSPRQTNELLHFPSCPFAPASFPQLFPLLYHSPVFLLFTLLPVICSKIIGRLVRRNKKDAKIVLTRKEGEGTILPRERADFQPRRERTHAASHASSLCLLQSCVHTRPLEAVGFRALSAT